MDAYMHIYKWMQSLSAPAWPRTRMSRLDAIYAYIYVYMCKHVSINGCTYTCKNMSRRCL